MIKHYLPKQANERLKTGAILVDVRSEAEHKFVGRVPDSILIPWVDFPDWASDESVFIQAFKRFGMGKNAEVILICRSGYRSLDAGNCLLNNGFVNIAHIKTGFEGDLDEHHRRGNLNGWRHDGLAWEQC